MAARFVGGADVQADPSIPHGTPEGYDAGCRGIGCPAGIEHGFSCSRAHLLNVSDYNYGRLRKAGKSVAEIAAAFDISHAGRGATAKTTVRARKTTAAKTTTKTIPTEEPPMSTISELLPDVADKLTQGAVTAAAGAEQEKTAAMNARGKKRATAKARAGRVAEAEAHDLTANSHDDVEAPAPTGSPVPAAQWAFAAEQARAEEVVQGTASGAAWVAAAAALEQMGLALAQYAEALRLTDELHRAERDAILTRIDKIEADIKPARAIATALASLNESNDQ